MTNDDAASSAGEGPSELVQVRRLAERSNYDSASVNAVFDATTLGHVGLVRNGRAAVIPMFVARDGDDLLLHGAPAAGVLQAGRKTADVCVEATVVDGLVLARLSLIHI